MKHIKLSKQTLCLTAKASEAFMEEMQLSIGTDSEDFIKDLFILRLDAHILSHTLEIKQVTRYVKPQSFIDWILRRPQKFEFIFDCKELLNNPPELPEDKRTLVYTIN